MKLESLRNVTPYVKMVQGDISTSKAESSWIVNNIAGNTGGAGGAMPPPTFFGAKFFSWR